MAEQNSGAKGTEKKGGKPPQAPGAINPERLGALVPKWNKHIGRQASKIVIEFTEEGERVLVYGKGDLSKPNNASYTLAEYLAAAKAANAASPAEALVAFRNKYELRLNTEFPSGTQIDGTPGSIQTFLQGRPFAERRIMLMSNKDYEKAPKGPAAAPAAANVAPQGA